MRKLAFVLALMMAVAIAPRASAQEAFVLEDIEIAGLLRISEGTVLNYLPLTPGDTVGRDDIQVAVRSLFRAGFFKDIAVRRDGNVLIFVVEERPSIAAFEVIGNKDIETPVLMQILRSEGLAEGRVFDRSVLEGMETEIYRVYHSRGKYSVHINTQVKELPNNLVDVSIGINEGALASIRDINIIGNEVFSDELLLEQMQLEVSGFWSWTDDADKYSREALVGDLEALRSYYLDRGYADFNIIDVLVSLSDDREDVFLTLRVEEGDVYTVESSEFRGDLKTDEEALRSMIILKDGETFSMQLAEAGAIFMTRTFESRGYAFAEVEPVPEVDRENKTVKVVYQIDTGARTFARNIIFKGAPKTNDEVFRREMRQFESAWLSNALIERGKVRLERLPFVESVQSGTEPVVGEGDLVDVTYEIKERSAGNFLVGVGFGGSATGTLLNASVTHANFMGTGERVQVAAVSSSFSKQLVLSHTDPYSTINGVSRTLELIYRSSDSFGRGLEEFNTETYGAAADFSWPISEYEYFGVGLSANVNELTGTDSAGQGGSSLTITNFITDPAHGETRSVPLNPTIDLIGIKYTDVNATASYSYDTRNRSIFATRGRQRILSVTAAGAPGDVDYYRGRISQRDFFPIGAGFTLTTIGTIRFADTYGETSELPPGQRFFAGGFDTIRGFRESYLGPRDETTYDADGNVAHIGTGFPTGGKLSTFAQVELLLPNYGAEDPTTPPENTQFSLFFDTGSLYEEFDDFDVDQFRTSAGVAATFLTPIGALRFSYGYPLRTRDGDRTERIQFTVGQVF
ncbi:MAG: outer membrane protein assembly factor BamA [Gammaproteobacteria bacterium]|nr:outer membrane protein assembly factor BamA [Gammaproteobacteria bacterium]